MKEQIKREYEADLKAIEIYLKMGYSKTDAISVFEIAFANCKNYNCRYELIKKHIEGFAAAGNKLSTNNKT